MDHASMAYNLLTEKDRVSARTLALEIEATNQKRQRETEKVVEEVKALVNKKFKDKKFIFAVGEHFPIGIAGLIAGKIADEFHKPTAVLQKEKDVSRGSFRSIPQINIIEMIGCCSHLLVKCGGHEQAAGITVANDKLEEFHKELDKLIEQELEGKECGPVIEIDAEILPEDIDFELIDGLNKFEPFGEGNEEPVFLMKNLIINELKAVGNGNKHLKMFLRPSGGSPKIFEAIGFNFNGRFAGLKEGDIIDAVFHIQEDNWNDRKKIQLKLIDLKIVKEK